MRVLQAIVLLVVIALCPFGDSCQAAGPTLEWIRQFGTFGGDTVAGLSLDGLDNVYLSFSLVGTNAPYGYPYMARYDLDGNQVWQRQISGSGVSADGLGNVFTRSVSNLDASGNELWSRQPSGSGISADGAGHVYAVSTLGRPLPSDDGLLEKFDAAGNLLWSRQFGTPGHEQSLLVAADAAKNIYTYGHVVNSDTVARPIATLTKFDADGNEYWTRQLESARYVNRGGVAADGLGNVYITGQSNAPILKPRVHLGYDAFVAKYDAAGNRLWLQEFGTAEFADDANSVAVDGLGNVFVVGNMGAPFLAKFDVDGNQQWLHQFGAADSDVASFVAADGAGKVYIAGRTRGDLGGPNAGGGGDDVFLAKINDVSAVPEPSGLALFVLAANVANLWRRKLVESRSFFG